MNFEEKLKSLAAKAENIKSLLETEEATKNALVMPFIAALGYDVFDPSEVIPEFTADVGIKRGEKVDYAIKRGDDIVMLIEAKKVQSELSVTHSSQLFRYFTTTKARIGVLTNGIVYRFFSDLEVPNRMDEKPFLELNLLNMRDSLLHEVNKLSKASFDLDNMLEAASDLKYMRAIRSSLEHQLDDPEDEFVRFFFQQANPKGRFVSSAKTQFSRLVKRTLSQFITDKVGDRLRSALAREDESAETISPSPEEPQTEPETPSGAERPGIITTEEELAAHRVITAIVCDIISAERVSLRDSKSYCAIIIDNNSRKPLARLHFNRSQKYVGTFDATKKETRHPIADIQDIYSFRDALRAMVTHWLSQDRAITENPPKGAAPNKPAT